MQTLQSFSIFLVALMLISIPVYAAGTTEGTNREGTANNADCTVREDCSIFNVPCGDIYGCINNQCVAIGSVTCDLRANITGNNTNTEIDANSQSRDSNLRAQAKTAVELAREQFAAKKAQIKSEFQNKNCENLETKNERIKCRLVKGEEYLAPAGTIPEACKLAENQERCVALYASVKNCYILDGKNKDACLKRAIGLRKKLSEIPKEERPQKARDYAVALLYDLEDRVESASEENKINPEDAVEIINKIVV
jgi:hypothetical protein